MRKFLAWIIAIVLTLTAVVYQRISGPTNPLKNSVEIDNTIYEFKLPRSFERTYRYNHKGVESNPHIETVPIKVTPTSNDIRALLMWKRYKSSEQYEIVEGVVSDQGYNFKLPAQPPAGKITYRVVFIRGNESFRPEKSGDVVLRFKDKVSSTLLIFHILLMFIAMLLSTYTAIAVLFRLKSSYRAAILTAASLLVGGLILGPFVQKAAFGVWWSGWPLGGDLTDTKTLVSFALWVIAIALNRSRKREYLFIFASIALLLIYTIPHSAAGSEFDWEKGVVSTSREIE